MSLTTPPNLKSSTHAGTSILRPAMTKLKAATVLNQIVRKRKRETVEEPGSESSIPEPNDPDASLGTTSGTSIVPTKTHDGGEKPRRAPKSKQPPTISRNGSSSNLVTSCVPWPASFQSLE